MINKHDMHTLLHHSPGTPPAALFRHDIVAPCYRCIRIESRAAGLME
nr:MAG TPA: hypothetical protein [Caudoviricetes sp.]